MIGKNVLIQIFLTVVGAVVGFASLSLSARLFGPIILGHLAYSFGLIGLIFAFSDLGLSKAQIHFTAAYSSAKKTLGTFILLKIVLLFLTSLAAITIALVTGVGQFEGIFLIVLAAELLTRLSESIFITFEGLQLSWPQNLARLIAKLVRLAAIILIGFKLTNVFGLGLTYLIESLALILFAFWLIRGFWPIGFSRTLANKFILYSLPFFAIVPLSYAQSNLLTVLLKHFQNSTEVGFYSAAYSLSMYLKVIFGTVMIFFFPKLSKLFGQNNLKAIERYLNLALKYLLAIFIPAFMIGFLLRKEIVLLVLGSDFEASVPVFSWMLAAAFILLLVNPYDYVLYATKKHARLVLINIFSLVLVVVMSFYLMSYLNLGAVGAALVNLVVWLVSGGYSIWLVKKHLGFYFYKQAFYFILPAVFLVSSAHIFLSYNLSSIIGKAAVGLIITLTYWLYLFLAKLIKPADIKYFTGLLKFRI